METKNAFEELSMIDIVIHFEISIHFKTMHTPFITLTSQNY